MRILYVYRVGDRCITHDGHIQLGYMPHTLERHILLNPEIEWVETYWCPDIFSNRYKRANYQAHMTVNEGSPKTDNVGCNSLEGK